MMSCGSCYTINIVFVIVIVNIISITIITIIIYGNDKSEWWRRFESESVGAINDFVR